MRVLLHALLPGRDGTGWYAVQPGDRPHRCSTKGCTQEAIAYHHAAFGGVKRIWKNKYHCTECLVEPMTVRDGRVWIERS